MNIIYCRYSPRPEHATERACSLQVQIEACEKYCHANGMSIDRVIEDPEVSARKTALFDRPGGADLMMLPAHSNVIAMKLDRVFRETIDGLTTLRFWKEHNTRFHLANEGGCTIDTSTATGELMATFLLGVTSWEPRAIAERTSIAMNHRMSNGKAHLNPSHFPYGMMEDPESRTHDKSGHHEGMIKCTEEQKVIGRIVWMHNCGMGLGEIGRTLTDEGITNRGNRWYPQTIKRILERTEA